MKEALSKLTDGMKFKHENAQDGLTPLGSGKSITLSPHWTIALEHLLNVTANKEVGITHERFIYNHQLYSSTSYTRSEQHTNHSVSLNHPIFNYGVILSLLNIKPICYCA